MKTPISWLKDFVDINVTPQVLADKLVGAGFEVEDIIYQADSIKNVVTGKITDIQPHPDSDHLLICQLSFGNKTEQIVTGAHNVNVSDIVPVALDGAVLPDGKEIHNGALRGVKSNGMLCSGDELGLTEEDFAGAGVDGILILPKDTPLNVDINTIVGTDDVILDVSVTANRPDCNSIIGIAREIAAVLGKTCKPLFTSYKACPERISNYIDVEINDKALCPRYMAKCVKDIVIKPSPILIRKRLKAVGIRPINNIVDITNYVLFEVGQPMHAFDHKNIAGSKIVVRRAVDGESFTALDGSTYSLESDMLVIADAQKPIGLAGIMGGENSEITSDTKTIIFESARFARDNIRRTSRKLNLRSDSSARFEKGIDFASQEIALNRALTLIQQQNAGTIISGAVDTYSEPVVSHELKVPTKTVNEILGIKVPYKRMVQILNSLNLQSIVKGKKLIVQVPPYREDIEGANDLAEEIIRVYGYNKIKSTLLKKGNQTLGGKSSYQKFSDKLKYTLKGLGADECITYSFIGSNAFDKLLMSEDDRHRVAVPILNPLGEEVNTMRTTLAPSMLSVVSDNIINGNKEGRFFEVARVYIPKSLPVTEQPEERDTLGIILFGKNEDFFTLKGVVQGILKTNGINNAEYKQAKISYMHTGRAAELFINGNKAGILGEIYPDVADNFDIPTRTYYAEIDMQTIFAAAHSIREFVATPKYPAIVRDLALVMKDTITADEIVKAIKKCTSKDMLENVKVFDVYKGEGIKKGYMSIAVSMTFRLSDRTLKDSEVSAQIDRVLKSLHRKFRARLR